MISHTTDAVTVHLRFFGLEENAISKAQALKRYVRPHGFLDTLKWVIYRIWNAVKAIFGRSDWQLSRRALSERFFTLLPEIASSPEMRYSLDKLCYTLLEELLIAEEDSTPANESLVRFFSNPQEPEQRRAQLDQLLATYLRERLSPT